MTRAMRGLVSIAAFVWVCGLSSGDDLIPNWSAPPYWSAPVRARAPQESRDGVGAEAVETLPTAPVPFVGIVPCRIVDTRGNGFTGAYGPPALIGNASARAFNVPAGPCPGIPADAAAFSINVAAILPAADGFLTAFPTGSAQPNASTLNFLGGKVVANSAVIAAGTSGSISVFVNVTTDVIIDINGYYTGSAVTSVTAGTGLTGGGNGAVTIGIANGGVDTSQLADNAVTSAKIAANAVTAGAIATGQVVKNLNGLHDSVTVAGSGTVSVNTAGSTITVGGGGTPSGSFVLGNSGDTTLIGAGYTEVGASNVEAWSATTTSGAPSARDSHTAVWTGSKMIVWGGTDSIAFLITGGQYDPVTDSWSTTSTTNAPAGRYHHTAVWTGAKMIVWGGSDGANRLNTGGQYDPVGNSWNLGGTSTTNAPAERELQTAVWTGTKMVVWGGIDNSATKLNTGGQYDPVGNSWMVGGTSTTNAPTARQYHTAVWTGSLMVVWGGLDGSGFSVTGGRYDPVGNTWTATALIAGVYAREQHTAVWTGSRMIIWGGFNSAPMDSGAQYDPVGDSWQILPMTDAPAARLLHTAVWTGSRMIVWGGYASGNLNSGGVFDPANYSWAAGGTSTTGAPTGRSRHAAVWTGTKMIVWGGDTGLASQPTNTGSRYAILSLYVKN